MINEATPSRLNAILIVGGFAHDIDSVRLELLKKLSQHEDIKVQVTEDYEDVPAITEADFIVSYTCDVTPSSKATAALKGWLEGGGRWFALHGTNSVIRFLDDGRVSAPNYAPEFMEMLGSRFVAHPPCASYKVDVTDSSHPLMAGLESFETHDEQHLLDILGDVHVLLHTHFVGETPRFERSHWPPAQHPVLYLRRYGKGEVLYLTLGHSRGPFDLQPRVMERQPVNRGSWELPVYHELLKRAIRWAKERRLNN